MLFRSYSFIRTGSYWGVRYQYDKIYLDLSGIVVGMKVYGSLGLDTTVRSIGSNFITLNSQTNNLISGAWVTVYFMPASPSSGTYTFVASNAFTFRTTDGILPYGSFPAVGLYLT